MFMNIEIDKGVLVALRLVWVDPGIDFGQPVAVPPKWVWVISRFMSQYNKKYPCRSLYPTDKHF